ncbi:MFP transporter [Pseudoalteromonas porphyrae]|uniref:Efflux RND transporter periplasmic adaptor subunit n=1 Tax=Pseudoalteromonas neustonica TaxID=1840331 RepID=A0ABU9U147_9GAMM|nr:MULTISPECIES: efflux RND transporter periplasmic adaptor subunit [Pseudoalteromonas]KPH96048.1 MFP transporter [Pseudoalteromonas porphyrae]NMR23975.1 efflux RND transporter periplasmic adaptor subunit [Pseudoalteromonas sp. NEC-BIFX-2020_015]NNG44421.1 efflux RND transporter periplasmic adaptor subunit [Pseudoalteromonas sp. NEC-BIFX-2020_002]
MRQSFALSKLSLSFFLFASTALLLQGCSEAPQTPQAAMQPASVATVIAATEDAPFTIELPATLSGSKEVEVRARVTGILESRNFDEGQTVTKGRSLFTVDLEPYQLALERAQAAFDGAKASLVQAQRDVKRLGKLRAEKSVSQRDYDNASSTTDIAKTNLAAAKVALKEAQLNLEYAQVKAPVAGVMGREFVSEGTYVSGPDLLLTQITQLDPIRLRFGISEREQLQMRQDEANGSLTLPQSGHWQTSIKLQDGSIYSKSGLVNFSDVRINPNTGTSELQAIIPNPDFKLRPGQFVRVSLKGAVRKNAFVVPQRAVLDNGMGKFVYVVAKGEQGGTIARPAPVVVGEWVQKPANAGDKNFWLIKSGINAGDEIIVDGMARIFFPGMPVAVNNATNSVSAE